jgi:uncharacterized protein (DUF1501 family)
MNPLTRRDFLKLGALGLGRAALGPRLGWAAAPAHAAGESVLVVVFLRGGMDALSAVVPAAGADEAIYAAARPRLRIPPETLLPLNAELGLHPALEPLHALYQAGSLAVVTATGLAVDTRSHFDAQEYMELGTPGDKSTPSGWLTRLLDSAGADGLVTAAALPEPPTALLQYPAITLAELGDLTQWDNGYLGEQQAALARLYAGDGLLRQSGRQTLAVVEAVAPQVEAKYRPAGGASYPKNGFGRHLAAVAQLIKLGLGLRAAAVDFGGWDTHQNQGYGGVEGYLANRFRTLAEGLAAFWRDLAEWTAAPVTVVVMSEFGRRLVENNSRGTDHGHGSALLALGAGVKGGQVYGAWPGLAAPQLYDRADLAVTTDYRQVLAELLQARWPGVDLEAVLPDFRLGAPLGLFE